MNARIKIRDIPTNTPPPFLEDNGELLLDLPEGFTFSLTKAATEGNEVSAIKREGTSSFSVPITEKNLWLLRKWIFPNTHIKDFSRIRVHAFDGPHILTEDRLDVLQVSLVDNSIEIGLFESPENGVADGANSLLLTDVDFGTFIFTKENLEANWEDALWEDGTTSDFYFPLIHYGNFIVDLYAVIPEDFRPCLSIAATLKRGFCTLGWAFDSPMLQTEWFRRLWWYGLGKEYYRHSDWGRLVRVDVQTDADIEIVGGLATTLYFNTETSDVGNNHEIGPGIPDFQSKFIHAQPVVGNLEYRITGRIEGIPAPGCNLIVAIGANNFYKVVELPAGDVDVDVSWIETVPQGDIMTISLGAYNPIFTVKAGFRVTINPIEKYYHLGDVVSIQESIDPHYTFLQFLQGLLHAGFRFDIDHGTKTVTMYATEQADIFGEGVIEGFYRPAYAARDMVDQTQHRSEVISFPKEDTPEALIIAFKKSSDKYIERLEVPEDEPLYSKRLAFPTGTKDLLEYSENPFFEPTANYRWFGQAAPKINTAAMWDNEEGQRSFEIGPRILYAPGLITQTTAADGAVVASQWSFDGALQEPLPYAAQAPGAKVGDPPEYPLGYFVYDDPEFSAFSLWAMWMKKDNRFYKNLPTIETLMLLTSRDYHTFNFRDRLEISFFGRPTILKAIAIKDFQTENLLPTPVTLQIDPDECG